MTAPPVTYESDEAIATITLNRPDVLNALDDALIGALREALGRAAADEAVRVLLLTGAGRGFCTGADLASVQPHPSLDLGELLRERYHPVILAMRSMPKAVICAVNGPAAGAGMSIALAADIVLAARSASFVQAFARIGLVPDAGSTWFLPRCAGEARARAMALLAEPIDAEAAERFGLVWRVFDDEQLMPQARLLAVRLAGQPPRAIALIKRALEQGPAHALPAQLELEARLQAEAGRTEDFAEGVAAFLQRRAPVFRGK